VYEVPLVRLPGDSFVYALEVEAAQLHAFWIDPGPRCMAAVFGFARYPATAYDPRSGEYMPTGLGAGWHWKASFSAESALELGVLHFLSCHLAVLALIEGAQQLGCLASVQDETGFWDRRDVSALAWAAAEWIGAASSFESLVERAVADSQFSVRPGRTGDLALRLREISSHAQPSGAPVFGRRPWPS
jgi:hypothetical protein